MKIIFVLFTAAIAFTGASAFAQGREVLDCKVPVQTGVSSVLLKVSVYNETSQDFVVLDVTDTGGAFQMFAQMKPGEFAAAIQRGELGALVVEENVSQDAGVIRNAGLIMLSQSGTGFEGLLSAHGNLYPLACVVK